MVEDDRSLTVAAPSVTRRKRRARGQGALSLHYSILTPMDCMN